MSSRLDAPVVSPPGATSPQRAARQSTATSRRLLPPARRSRVLDSDIAWAVGAYVAVVVGMWTIHGGMSRFGEGTTGIATAITQLSGLAASAAGLAGLVLTARPAILERRYGLDRLFNWHRILGETMAVLVGVHVATGVAEWSASGTVGEAIADLTGREPYMAGATVGALLIGLVTISSLRSIRRRLSYETWYFVHLLAYVGFALSFSHTIVQGGDLADDRLARWVWVGAHLAVAAWIVWGRWGRLVGAFTRPLRVAEIRPLNDDTAEVRLDGPGLRFLRGDAGQFAMLRPLSPRLWWQAHPYSLSAAPDTNGLRFTVKRRGDASGALLALPVGTRVAVEGPYGACTPEVIGDRTAIFVVGGVGIAPVRALLERLPATSRPVVLYRAHRVEDLVHLDELHRLCAERGGIVHTLVGPTARLATKDPFSAAVLRRAAPDVAERVAVLCGPERLLSAARTGLLAAGVAPGAIHYERVWW